MRKFLCILLILIYSIYLIADGVEPAGSGTEEDPFQIAELDNLLWFCTTPEHWDKYYIQTADIDGSDMLTWNEGQGYLPVGDYGENFTGHYDGQDHIIENFYINQPDESYVGLIGYATGSVIRDLGLVNVNITGSHYTGTLVGQANEATISNCYSNGTVNGIDHVGGIAGANTNSSNIINCHSSCAVEGSSSKVGGLVGRNYQGSNITGSYCTGDINGNNSTGGIAGEASYSGSISNCYHMGTVTGHSQVGGLVGYSQHFINITNCFCHTNVSGYNTVGGIIGEHRYVSHITNCWCSGSVSGNYPIGGLAGVVASYSTVDSSFWNIETSGQTTSEGGVGLTTLEMQTYSTYINAGWDFIDETTNGEDDIWGINYEENDGYPFLAWQGYENNPVDNDENELIPNIILAQNYPNPFNPETTINFSLNDECIDPELNIFNIKGQIVHSVTLDKDQTSYRWNAGNMPSGVYFYQLKVNGTICTTKRMLMLK